MRPKSFVTLEVFPSFFFGTSHVFFWRDASSVGDFLRHPRRRAFRRHQSENFLHFHLSSLNAFLQQSQPSILCQENEMSQQGPFWWGTFVPSNGEQIKNVKKGSKSAEFLIVRMMYLTPLHCQEEDSFSLSKEQKMCVTPWRCYTAPFASAPLLLSELFL